MMTEQAYIAAHQKLSGQYNDNQSSMEDYLAGLQALKAQYLKGRNNATLPIVP
jgi:hypothetical protein